MIEKPWSENEGIPLPKTKLWMVDCGPLLDRIVNRIVDGVDGWHRPTRITKRHQWGGSGSCPEGCVEGHSPSKPLVRIPWQPPIWNRYIEIVSAGITKGGPVCGVAAEGRPAFAPPPQARQSIPRRAFKLTVIHRRWFVDSCLCIPSWKAAKIEYG